MITTKVITAMILMACLIVLASSAAIDVTKNACQCTTEFDPVCASNGITYTNKCKFECHNDKKDLTILNSGTCDTFTLQVSGSECTRKCNHLKRPVCGTDNVTYENPCKFKCAQQVNSGLKVKHQGAC